MALLWSLLFLLPAAPVAADTLRVMIPAVRKSNAVHETYIVELLQRALERSAAPGEQVLLERQPQVYTQKRLLAELHKGGPLDVIWTMTTREREDQLVPVRVPLFKGMLGHRIFLIRRGEQARFDGIENLHQLAQLVAGQGSQWPDTAILRANGLPVVTTTNYEQLFSMLLAQRFDYYPRGLNEFESEYALHGDSGITVEQKLMLVYPAPMYFFVAPGKEALAKRLERGLLAMVADGSFDRFFYSHPVIIRALKAAHIKDRRVLHLGNPQLPPQTPLQDRRLWLPLASGG